MNSKDSAQNFNSKLLSKIDKIDSEKLRNYLHQIILEKQTIIESTHHLSEGLVLINIKNEINYMNKSAEKLLNKKGLSWLGKKANIFFNFFELENPIQEMFENPNTSFNYEIEGILTENQILSLNIFPVVIDDAIQSIAMIFKDHTYESEMNEQKIQDYKLDSIRLLSASIAHEIGNPLNNMDIHLQLVQRELKNSKTSLKDSLQESIDIVHDEVKRMHQILKEFLSAVRPLNVNYQGDDINLLIEKIMRSFNETFKLKSIHLKMILQSNLPKIQIDSNQISQAIVNIVKNAIEAMSDDGKFVVKTESKNNMLEMSFEDNGCGIDAELMASIFDPYVTKKKQGSGLGLMIVQRIIKDHRGQIFVQSKPGGGAKFTIRLPFKYKIQTKMILGDKTKD